MEKGDSVEKAIDMLPNSMTERDMAALFLTILSAYKFSPWRAARICTGVLEIIMNDTYGKSLGDDDE